MIRMSVTLSNSYQLLKCMVCALPACSLDFIYWAFGVHPALGRVQQPR